VVARFGSGRLMEYKVPYILEYLMRKKLRMVSVGDYFPDDGFQN